MSSNSSSRRRPGERALHSILPKAIVTELKTDGRPQARRHDSVAVLFCDLVGFTEYCDRNAPERRA